MGTFAAGQVVILPFPFSELTARKYRPALLLAAVGKGDWIVCQITRNPISSPAWRSANPGSTSWSTGIPGMPIIDTCPGWYSAIFTRTKHNLPAGWHSGGPES